jgi:very-short-patch-repair endonuclease
MVFKTKVSGGRKKRHKTNYKSPKTSKLISVANAKYLKGLSPYTTQHNKWWIGKANKFKNELIENATVYEASLCNFLNVKNIKVEFQKIVYIDNGELELEITGFYIADIFLPKYSMIIEVDGGYHFTEAQKLKDLIRTSELKTKGYRVFGCTNEETFNMDKLYIKLLQSI